MLQGGRKAPSLPLSGCATEPTQGHSAGHGMCTRGLAGVAAKGTEGRGQLCGALPEGVVWGPADDSAPWHLESGVRKALE